LKVFELWCEGWEIVKSLSDFGVVFMVFWEDSEVVKQSLEVR
jgi:hypothetical protein